MVISMEGDRQRSYNSMNEAVVVEIAERSHVLISYDGHGEEELETVQL